ncbi:interferon-induced protein with tetratricopeptide repeats 5-like [Gracilinanus agilis]|uniref:interferon-induced protein with tetratricopeptide repeats 5-like n=1 Tax=Gracilinanus agilis TaxID=191870 RepID=UPI001CFCFB62|nr:interferon-induced protein with tetratricopeptide repeats 5-like [Gracilinanus agilis]
MTIKFYIMVSDEVMEKSETSKNSLKYFLLKLECHFTWNLQKEDIEVPYTEERIDDQLEYLTIKSKVSLFNLLAYVKHLNGQNKEALESLKNAEGSIQQDYADQMEKRSIVTWGNYAWIYYHMDRLPEAQTYLDKVEASCKKLSSAFQYKVDLPEIDCEKGWSLLKFGGRYYERAKACFEKALQSDPEHPEFNTGFAIVMYRMDDFHKDGTDSKSLSLSPLKKALSLDPESTFLKVLLALKLQDIDESSKGEKYIKEALDQVPVGPYILRYAAKFYRRQNNPEKAIELLKKAFRLVPTSAFLHHQMGLCYRSQMIQIKKATRNKPRGKDKEEVDRLVRTAIFYFEAAIKQKPLFVFAYLDLANMYSEANRFSDAEEIFKKVLGLEHVREEEKQQAHFHYGRFLEHSRKAQDVAIYHYLEGIKINPKSCTKLVGALQKLAAKRLSQNSLDTKSLGALGFIHKLKGEKEEALQYYEKALKQDPSNTEYISALLELRLSI